MSSAPGPAPAGRSGAWCGAVRLRADHRATLLAVSCDGAAHVNPAADFRLRQGDDAVVVAESLGTLAPLPLQHD